MPAGSRGFGDRVLSGSRTVPASYRDGALTALVLVVVGHVVDVVARVVEKRIRIIVARYTAQRIRSRSRLSSRHPCKV